MNAKTEEAIREAKCIDYDKAAKERFWWLNKTGGTAEDGLTVLDYFAAKAMQGLLSDVTVQAEKEVFAKVSYDMAEAMMNERTKREQMK